MPRIILLILALSLSLPASANFRVGVSDEYLKVASYIIDDLRELYRRAGISDIRLEAMPGARLIGLAEEQRLDAIDARLRSSFSGTEYIPIDVPVYLEIRYYAFKVSSSDINIQTIDDLSRYRVVIERHNKWSQELLKNNHKIELAPSVSSIYQMLLSNRADLVLLTDFEYTSYVTQGLIEEGLIMPASPPLVSEWIYHFVHKRHENKVELLESIIRDMQAEGKFVLR